MKQGNWIRINIKDKTKETYYNNKLVNVEPLTGLFSDYWKKASAT